MSEVQKRLATDQTLQGTNTKLEALSKDATLQAIAEILTSVKSVNSKHGVVVLDMSDIPISKTTPSSKTAYEVLTEMTAAVEATPLTVTAENVSGDDYTIVVTLGTPS